MIESARSVGDPLCCSPRDCSLRRASENSGPVTAHGVDSIYPAIEEHGIIGDLRTAALVSTDGNIDFFCPLRFDNATLFASLLDD